ncbi:MAG: restriction endonuclease subunit M [Candidatus Saccharimonadales bacterium]
MSLLSKIDISENTLRNRGQILDILLKDNTKSTKGTIRNIIWATDSYVNKGRDYTPKKSILREQVTGVNGKVIQPRAAKSREEQKYRTKDKAEVFTPLKVVKEMNMAIDWSSKNWPVGKDNWMDYISELRLEITCGEAPFIAGRYNPTANTGVVITPKSRVGFFDRKLQKVGEFADSKNEWLKYAEIALKSTYGYEWQGDNLLIARENILLTIDDFYKDFCINKLKLKSRQNLTDKQLENFAEIISWNIWQMDGLKYVIPMSCKHEIRVTPGENTIFGVTPDVVEKYECEGCKFNRPTKHNGKYAKIIDWTTGKPIKFVSLLNH